MRQSKLTKAARGRECQVRIPGVCNGNHPFGSGKKSGQQEKPKPSTVADKLRRALTGRKGS